MPRRDFVQRTSHITSDFVFETRLREDVIKVCKNYIKDCRKRWIQAGHHDAEGKMNIANDLLLSAEQDSFEVFKYQIDSCIDWLDENYHDSTKLREPFEQYNEAINSRQMITYGVNNSAMFNSFSSNDTRNSRGNHRLYNNHEGDRSNSSVFSCNDSETDGRDRYMMHFDRGYKR